MPYHTRLCRSREGDQSIRLPASGRASISRVRQVGPPPSGDGYPVERGCFPCLTASFAQLPTPGLERQGGDADHEPLQLAPLLSKRSKTMRPSDYRHEFLAPDGNLNPANILPLCSRVEGTPKTARRARPGTLRRSIDEIDDTGKRSQRPSFCPNNPFGVRRLLERQRGPV